MLPRRRWVAALGLAVLAATAGARPSLPGATQRRKVEAADGTALALYRYPPGGESTRPAVLLIPELGFGREAYDLADGGWARALQAAGRDAFVLELRGQGLSGAPPAWHLADLIAQDLPAALAAIAQAHPGPVDLVVHGYSGALVLAACPVEARGRIRRVVALAPAVAAEVPNPITEKLLTEGGAIARWAQGAPHRADFDLLFAHGSPFPFLRLGQLRQGTTDLGRTAAAELLGWMRQGDLTFADGTTLRGRLAQYDRPTSLLLPLRDNFAHPEFAAPLRELAPKATVTVQVLSRANLLEEDYSHLSLLHGSAAPREVIAPAIRFLDAPEPAVAP